MNTCQSGQCSELNICRIHCNQNCFVCYYGLRKCCFRGLSEHPTSKDSGVKEPLVLAVVRKGTANVYNLWHREGFLEGGYFPSHHHYPSSRKKFHFNQTVILSFPRFPHSLFSPLPTLHRSPTQQRTSSASYPVAGTTEQTARGYYKTGTSVVEG